LDIAEAMASAECVEAMPVGSTVVMPVAVYGLPDSQAAASMAAVWVAEASTVVAAVVTGKQKVEQTVAVGRALARPFFGLAAGVSPLRFASVEMTCFYVG
jgi:hypothetical protein